MFHISIGRYWGGIAGRRIGQDYAAEAAARAAAQAAANAAARAEENAAIAEQYSQQAYEQYSQQPIYEYQDYEHTIYGPPEGTPQPSYIPEQEAYAPTPPPDYFPPEGQDLPPAYIPPEEYAPPVYQEYPPEVYEEPPPGIPSYSPPVATPPGIPSYSPPVATPEGCPPISPVCATSSRRYFLGFSQDTVAAGAQVLITARPQYLVRFDRLVIPSNIGQFFDLVNITIGNVNQTVAAGANSGVVMSEVATYVELGLDTAYPGIDIVLTVTNVDAQARNFRATLYGVLVA